MRSSSIKSLTIVAALAITLAAVPRAEAKPTRSSARGGKTTLAQLISRFFRIGTQEDYPSDPIPKNQESTNASGTTIKEDVSPAATTPK